jgi:integrase
MLEESAARSDFIERKDYERLFAALPDYLRLPLAIGYLTGMRRAEILGLKWDHVDLIQSTITLRAGQTKNGRGRVIPVVPQLQTLLTGSTQGVSLVANLSALGSTGKTTPSK